MKKSLLITIVLQTILCASFSGTIIDENTKEPLSNVVISDSRLSVKSDENGFFSIKNKQKTYHIKAYGYRPYSFSSDINNSTLSVESIKVKALYLTFWGANIYSKTAKKILKIIDETEVNAVIVDVKNE